MKKSILVLVVVVLLAVGNVSAQETIKVGASPVPHGEILAFIVPLLAEQGVTLEVIEFTDYVLPNLALADGEIDANFFQHLPYLEGFNSDHRLDLVSLAGIHIEPLGIYSNSVSSVEEIGNGSTIAIPNDATNGRRALLLLEAAGLIGLNPDVGLEPTIFDIISNPNNIRFYELEAAQLPRSLDDTTASVINGNYALEAGFFPPEDSLFLEGAESPYVNVIAVRAADVDNPLLAKLVEVIQSEAVRAFILDKWEGSVVPTF